MIIHIVMFKFQSDINTQEIARAKKMILDLKESIVPLRDIEVGINFADESRAMDMSLIARFNDKLSLDIYAKHPSHLDVIKYIKSITEYSKVVDYEIQD